MLVSNPMEPLILADGTKIDPGTGKIIKDRKPSQFVEVPSGIEAQEIVARTRRSIAELPLPTQNMNALTLVLTYTLWGLSDNDIAVASSLSVQQVKNIKKLDHYRKLSEDITRSILEHEASDIRSFFHQKARVAAEKIVEIAEEDDGVLGFKAAQDILDRSGHRPADVVEHRHRMMDALKIEHISSTRHDELPVIEADYREIN